MSSNDKPDQGRPYNRRNFLKAATVATLATLATKRCDLLPPAPPPVPFNLYKEALGAGSDGYTTLNRKQFDAYMDVMPDMIEVAMGGKLSISIKDAPPQIVEQLYQENREQDLEKKLRSLIKKLVALDEEPKENAPALAKHIYGILSKEHTNAKNMIPFLATFSPKTFNRMRFYNTSGTNVVDIIGLLRIGTPEITTDHGVKPWSESEIEELQKYIDAAHNLKNGMLLWRERLSRAVHGMIPTNAPIGAPSIQR